MELFTNAATSTLNGTINNSTTTVIVVDASTFPASGNFRIVIDSEIMKVTAVSSNTLTVVRAQESTTATSHNSNSAVTVILTAASIDAFRSDSVLSDTFANRPSAGVKGRLFLTKDGNGPLNYDDGSNWQPFGLFNFALTTPVTSDFATTVGSGTDTFTQNGDCIVHKMTGNGASNQSKARVRTLTLNKTYTTQLSAFLNPKLTSGGAFAGLIIRDSSTGNTRAFGFNNALTGAGNTQLCVLAFTGASSFVFSNNVLATGNSNFPGLFFIRINQPSSGSRLFQWSPDNLNWITFLSESWNATVANPNQVGYMLYSDTIYNDSAGMLIRHYTEA